MMQDAADALMILSTFIHDGPFDARIRYGRTLPLVDEDWIAIELDRRQHIHHQLLGGDTETAGALNDLSPEVDRFSKGGTDHDE